MSTLVPGALLSLAMSRHSPWYPASGVVAMPSPDGSTVQVNEVLASAPLPSCAVTVTVLVPAVAGVPLIVPEPEIEVPAGRPVAVKLRDCPLVLSLAETGTETAVPASPSCGPGLVMVTGWLAPGCRLTRAKPSSWRGG